jgi:hypothetical protein
LVDFFFFFLAAGAVAAFFLSSFKNFLIILVSCSLSFEVRGVLEEEVEDVDEEEEDDVDDDEDSSVGRFGLAPVFLAGGCLPDVPCWVGVEAAESAVALRSRSDEACRC